MFPNDTFSNVLKKEVCVTKNLKNALK